MLGFWTLARVQLASPSLCAEIDELVRQDLAELAGRSITATIRPEPNVMMYELSSVATGDSSSATIRPEPNVMMYELSSVATGDSSSGGAR